MWDEDGRRRTTDAEEQRRGTWLIDGEIALKLEQIAIEKKRKDERAMHAIGETWKAEPNGVLDQWLKELEEKTPNYISEFERLYGPKGYELVGMQGCGNLTMNGWFVGFVNSDFTDHQPMFLYRSEEPFEERSYTCLVKDKQTKAIEIKLLRFNRYQRRVREVMDRQGSERDVTDRLEFAVFAQQLVEGGQLVDFRRIVAQFEDIRHLFKLPNINPNIRLSNTRQAQRPRMLFGDERVDDVWFGEREMTRPGREDLLRHALTEPILLDRTFENMGVGWDLLTAAFGAPTGGGYRELKGEHALYAPRARGEWRRYSDNVLEVFLQRNVYAYTMLGLNEAGDVVASAAAGQAGKVGQTLEGMAQNMISMGARDVLLCDEGNDVFQWVANKYTVEPRRGRLRAVFAFARRKNREAMNRG
jgi:hypothetical protein